MRNELPETDYVTNNRWICRAATAAIGVSISLMVVLGILGPRAGMVTFTVGAAVATVVFPHAPVTHTVVGYLVAGRVAGWSGPGLRAARGPPRMAAARTTPDRRVGAGSHRSHADTTDRQRRSDRILGVRADRCSRPQSLRHDTRAAQIIRGRGWSRFGIRLLDISVSVRAGCHRDGGSGIGDSRRYDCAHDFLAEGVERARLPGSRACPGPGNTIRPRTAVPALTCCGPSTPSCSSPSWPKATTTC